MPDRTTEAKCEQPRRAGSQTALQDHANGLAAWPKNKSPGLSTGAEW